MRTVAPADQRSYKTPRPCFGVSSFMRLDPFAPLHGPAVQRSDSWDCPNTNDERGRRETQNIWTLNVSNNVVDKTGRWHISPPRGFELLAETFARIERREPIIDTPLLQAMAGLSNELAQSDFNLERLLGLIRTASAPRPRPRTQHGHRRAWIAATPTLAARAARGAVTPDIVYI